MGVGGGVAGTRTLSHSITVNTVNFTGRDRLLGMSVSHFLDLIKVERPCMSSHRLYHSIGRNVGSTSPDWSRAV